jgi:hypothetical protein
MNTPVTPRFSVSAFHPYIYLKRNETTREKQIPALVASCDRPHSFTLKNDQCKPIPAWCDEGKSWIPLPHIMQVDLVDFRLILLDGRLTESKDGIKEWNTHWIYTMEVSFFLIKSSFLYIIHEPLWLHHSHAGKAFQLHYPVHRRFERHVLPKHSQTGTYDG